MVRFEGRGDLGVAIAQGVRPHGKVQNDWDGGKGGCRRHMPVVENQGYAEVANVAILILAGHALIIFAEGLAMVSSDNE